jgi:phosphocarrier protein HPr
MPPPSTGPTIETVIICNKRGLHARASAKFVAMAESFEADILVSSIEEGPSGDKVCGTSIMGLMMLAAAIGHSICIEATGEQAFEAVTALSALVNRRFEEES